MSQAKRLSKWPEFIIAGFGLIALLIAEWILTSAIPGTQYSQGDGKVAQAVIHTALNFGGIFQLNNINPLQGIGSQLQPHNVWANPAYWPFAILDSPLALDVSALVALGCLALACYVMARCFDVPVLPSIVAAQLSIILFGPLANMLVFYQVFWINPGTAVVYAPQLVALGIIARLEPGRIRDFIFAVGSIFALLLYSLSCDPLWIMISGIGLLGAFTVVALSPLRIRPILVRCAALGCCLVLLLISGAIGYVYTLTQYSTRVWFSDALAYVPQAFLASIVFISPKTAGSYYAICPLGWVLGLLFARARVRVLVVAGLVSFAIFVAYSATFLLMRKSWFPFPLYIEHSLFPLFTTAAIAGYWAALRMVKLPRFLAPMKALRITKLPLFLALRAQGKIASLLPIKQASATRDAPGIFHVRRWTLAAWLSALVVAASVPTAAPIYAVRAGPTAPNFDVPFPNEPELVRYLKDTIGLRVGSEFRGSIGFVASNEATMYNLWIQGIPTVNEYSQLITPQAAYFSAAFFGYNISLGLLNHFGPWVGKRGSYDVVFKMLQPLGLRYIIHYSRLSEADQRHLPFVTMPHRPVDGDPADWIVYELPNPNIGNYSPTEVVTAKSGAEIITTLAAPHFDFTKQAVLSTAIDERLVPAHNMRLSLIRGGLHVSGSSDGTSLVLLPQQFSHCLRARDSRVRLVRANLLMTGMIFSDSVDTDIVFDYGIFSPGCRRIDLAELRQLIERQAPKDERIFVDWDGAVARLRDAGIAIGLLAQEPPPAPPPATETVPPGELSASGPVITKETALADLQSLTTSGFAFIAIQGLNAEVEAGEAVVVGQPILRLVTVPTTGRHYFAAQSTTLNKNQVYRIAAWVKDPAGVKVEMQVSDELRPRSGTPANYGSAIFDPAARRVLSSSGRLKGRGIEQGPDGWQKIWVDLASADGEIVLAFGFFSSKVGNSFKGDGRLGLTFGGIEVAERN
jgi:hypothetical protein